MCVCGGLRVYVCETGEGFWEDMFPTVAMWTGKKQDSIKEKVFSH